MNTRRLVFVFALAVMIPTACATGDDGAEDGADDSFLTSGSADTGGISECTPEALGVLRVANESDLSALKKKVRLASSAANNIVAYRLGDDGAPGTPDDEVFDSLKELDAVPYVGPIAFAKLLTYARANGYVSTVDGGPLVGTCQDIRGRQVDVYVDDATGVETRAPADLSGATFAALVPDPAVPGSFSVHPGLGAADGSFTLPAVPQGTYYLKVVAPGATIPSYYVTDDRRPDLGRYAVGRSDARRSTSTTSIALNVTGMTAWQADDALELVVPHVDGFAYPNTVTGATGKPAVGATALASLTFDWSLAWGSSYARLPLIDGARGDLAVLAHLGATTSSTGRAVQVLTETFRPSAFTQLDGAPATLTGAFAALPVDHTLGMTVNLPSYAAAYAQMSPRLLDGWQAMNVWVTRPPAGAARGGASSSVDVITAYLDADFSAAVDFGQIRYADPFPASWGNAVEAELSGGVAYTLPGTTKPAYLTPLLWSAAPLAADRADVALVQAPPRNVRIDGQPLAGDVASLFNATTPAPLLMWDTPATGSPSYYTVYVYRLNADGDRTIRTRVAVLRTRYQFVNVPKEVLAAGERYAFIVRAVSNAAGAMMGPGGSTFPAASADFASGIVTLSGTVVPPPADGGFVPDAAIAPDAL